MTEPSIGDGLRQVLVRLLQDVNASRCTIRLDIPTLGLQVDAPAAEATAGGVRSVSQDTDLDQRSLSTVQWLDRHRRNLIQDDLEAGDLPVPEVLTVNWNVKAQMLGPIVEGDRLVGWISVHQVGHPRHWLPEDEAGLSRAVSRVHDVIRASAG